MNNLYKNLFITTLFAILLSSSAYASQDGWQGISASYGIGRPNHLRGARISYELQPSYLANLNIKLLEFYFDFSGAYWKTNYFEHKHLFVFAAAPVARINLAKSSPLDPYIEGSIGGAFLTHDHLGHRDLGAHIAFQDMIGVGATFGERHQYDLSFRYLHYSNAGLFKPNNGIDVKLLTTFTYRF